MKLNRPAFFYSFTFSILLFLIYSLHPAQALTFVEMQKDGVAGVDGLDGATSVAVSPDNSHVYAAGFYDDAVTVFVVKALTTIPTLSEWGMIILSLTLGITAIYSIRKKPHIGE